MHPTDDTIGQTAVSARTPCAETLTQIGNLRDRDRQVRGAAVRALGRSGEAQAVEPLCAALQDEDTYVRANDGRRAKALRWRREAPKTR